jgi:hypothetical protein
MGQPQGGRYHGGVRRHLTPRCIALDVTLLVLLASFVWLTRWQLDRAEGGNTLSWAYVILWPCFALYAIYTWWNLIHAQSTRIPGRGRADAGATDTATSATGGAPVPDSAHPPGWALTGGRKRNVAIAASAPIDPVTGGRRERFTPQTPDEAARLAEYNRYLAELSAEDAEASS